MSHGRSWQTRASLRLQGGLGKSFAMQRKCRPKARVLSNKGLFLCVDAQVASAQQSVLG